MALEELEKMNHIQYLLSSDIPPPSSSSSSSATSTPHTATASTTATASDTATNSATIDIFATATAAATATPSVTSTATASTSTMSGKADSTYKQEYVISPDVIQNIKAEFIEKKEPGEITYPSSGRKRKGIENTSIYPYEMYQAFVNNTNTITGSLNESAEESESQVGHPIIDSGNGGMDLVQIPEPGSAHTNTSESEKTSKSKKDKEKWERRESKESKEIKEINIMSQLCALPLAFSGLDLKMKKRCADLSLKLLQQYSNLKNKIDNDKLLKLSATTTTSISTSTSTSILESDPQSMIIDTNTVPESINGTNTATTTAPPVTTTDATTPVPPTSTPQRGTMDLDSSLPQAVCQLLAHVTRDKDVRDYFENCGGVHRLITTIPSFEGEMHFPIIVYFYSYF